MKKPEMILFDFGHTLAFEQAFDQEKGYAAMFRHIRTNPDRLTPQDVYAEYKELFGAEKAIRTEYGVYLTDEAKQELIFGLHGITFDADKETLQRLYFDGTAPTEPMPFARETLAALRAMGMRTGVISNTSFPAHAHIARLKRHFPEHEFEFLLSSAECVLCKPNPAMFRLALRKAALSADKVWYVGDNPVADGHGAHAAGIFPVWVTGVKECLYPVPKEPPACEHLEIHSLLELTEVLKELEQAL